MAGVYQLYKNKSWSLGISKTPEAKQYINYGIQQQEKLNDKK